MLYFPLPLIISRYEKIQNFIQRYYSLQAFAFCSLSKVHEDAMNENVAAASGKQAPMRLLHPINIIRRLR
jgi:hypothetical protein